jgi:nitroimidazol reductase NimA-like FMN-containing flavoprotein (pyridoxamine 5'-phosphate oxidase superfamily)
MMVEIPQASRPHMPGYGVPKTKKGTLAWSHVAERMEQARRYWVVTVDSGGQPHAVPVDGLWIENALYFGGGSQTRWIRNLTANPHVAVHLESGTDVVMMEGTAEYLSDPKHPIAQKLDEASQAKYHLPSGTPCWVLHPKRVFAWSKFLSDATRWVFEDAPI